MYLTVTDAAQAKLEPYIEAGAKVVLDLDDGVGAYSKMGVCSLDTSFRILILDKVQESKDYALTLDSNVGEVLIKDYSKMYLDEDMTLDVKDRFNTLYLKSPSGVLDGNVPIVDLRP
ncbi:hypothetical protein RU97_GL000451 [Enterococcus canis]|uniref:Core domain-containing protein n=1 Tax=Enterococcus canis TaxID=214095 RepID=A0A1L8RKF6_9ENTE|nr:iron-sulfur cluster biosynthesis family protein [Enterococcus canis]OJG20218.1 hypothetical protein RU97_GL000451 [Enterococcus canis]